MSLLVDEVGGDDRVGHPGDLPVVARLRVDLDGLEALRSELGFEALLLAIRRDEHGIRAKERYFSPRDRQFRWNYEDQPPELWDQYVSEADEDYHLRVHPLLEWRELDVWLYVQRENLPVNPLYFSRDGKRYRSLGCHTCCSPVESEASTIEEIIEEISTGKTAERAGRAQDKEDANTMQKLHESAMAVIRNI